MTCAILWCMLQGGQIMVSFDSDLHCYEAPPSKAGISAPGDFLLPKLLSYSGSRVLGILGFLTFDDPSINFILCQNLLAHVYIIKVTHFSFN